MPILDYHRHCTNCSYDLCLACCRDLRRASSVPFKGEFINDWSSKRSKDVNDEVFLSERTSCSESAINFAHQFPKWKVNTDGTITCGPAEAGGCGSSKLVLRRIFKINWVAKLVKSADEMVSGCIIRKVDSLSKCPCEVNKTCESTGLSKFTGSRQCSKRDDSSDNFLYFPLAQDIKNEGISHFYEHWVNGQPIIIRHTFELPLASSWNPSVVWRGIQETMDERNDVTVKVKAFNCSSHSEVHFILILVVGLK